MEYPWLDKFVMHAAPEDMPLEPPVEDTPPDEATGTNEPVDVPADSANPDEQPNPDLAQDITESDPLSDIGTDAVDTSAQPVDTSAIDGMQTQIDDLKKQLEDLQSDYDMEGQIEILKKRLDNLQTLDDVDLNDSLNQSASSEISYIKRAIRRYQLKKTSLTGEQQTEINLKLEQHPQMSCQEIAAEIASSTGANEQDIIDFIRNSEFRFRHRHGPHESSVIDWNILD